MEDVLAKRHRSLRDSCPVAIRKWWAQLMACRDLPLSSCAASDRLIDAATNLCIASDEASAGIGVTEAADPFLSWAEAVLYSNNQRSFCLHVPVDKLAVLGKQHTPQRGCTIRSLTHHLALYTPTEIHAYWRGPYNSPQGEPDVFNLLLLPWPVDVRASDFGTSLRRAGGRADPGFAPHHRYFDYRPGEVLTPAAMAKRVSQALDNAVPYVDQIHGIVLPELALTPDQYVAVEQVAVRRKAILIAGLRGEGTEDTNDMPVNACAFQPLGLTAVQEQFSRPGPVWKEMRQVQHKHHRWCLDRHQVLQYRLGGRLPASRDCWERAFIGPRDINFVTLGTWLTSCVLICEDLARQDPVADVIRAVGPNLVVALLMDGPQLRSRWPARYASVLAEDPGCSVLTLTSLGMSTRSRPRELADTDRSRTIALWRDAIYGDQEIELEPGHDACVLSLVCKTEQEFTIDGRGDKNHAHFPVFAGASSFDSRVAF